VIIYPLIAANPSLLNVHGAIISNGFVNTKLAQKLRFNKEDNQAMVNFIKGEML
jgi:hypothetical protein